MNNFIQEIKNKPSEQLRDIRVDLLMQKRTTDKRSPLYKELEVRLKILTNEQKQRAFKKISAERNVSK